MLYSLIRLACYFLTGYLLGYGGVYLLWKLSQI